MRSRLLYLFVSILTVFAVFDLRSATCVSTGNGAWANSSTWSCGAVPSCGDSIVILAGHTVTISATIDHTGCGTKIFLHVFGTLHINGGRLKLPCNSKVVVRTGGKVIASGGGGNSRDIQICGNVEWNAGAGDYNGPGCMPPTWTGCAGVLPVRVISFRAEQCGRDNICLAWDVGSETGLKYYEIERLGAFHRFETLGRVLPTGIMHYEYLDKPPDNTPTLYYRLKAVDLSGEAQTSDPLLVSNQDIRGGCIIFPNPATGAFSLDCNSIPDGSPLSCIITNQVGELVASLILPPGEREARIDTLPKGLYFCAVISDNQPVQRLKLIVE